MNKVILTGRMTNDPTLVITKDELAISNFTIAVNNGKDNANFIRCTAFGKRAEVIAEYFKKGSGISVCGHLQNSQYEKEGVTVYSLDVIIEDFTFVDKKESTLEEEVKPKTNRYKRY